MTRHRLDNDAWGFESSCFVCEGRNERGLRVPSFHDDGSGRVVPAPDTEAAGDDAGFVKG